MALLGMIYLGNQSMSAITVERLADTFAARVSGIDLSQPLASADWQALHDAYLAHKVLVLHGQSLSAAQLYEFGQRFGQIEPHTVQMYHHGEFPGITILSNRVEMGRPQGIRDAGSHWHSDYSYKAVPANVTILYSLEVPPEGGDTIMCDMQAAYEALPQTMKDKLEGKRQRIQYRWSKDRTHPESRWSLLSETEMAATPEVNHPVVRAHQETGRTALYCFQGISSGVQGIEGLSEADSDATLATLFAHCEDPRFHYRFKWGGPSNILLWDNRCTMHQATTNVLPPDQHRTLWRINTRGDVPV
jgi:taurine dioxygenase